MDEEKVKQKYLEDYKKALDNNIDTLNDLVTRALTGDTDIGKDLEELSKSITTNLTEEEAKIAKKNKFWIAETFPITLQKLTEKENAKS